METQNKIVALQPLAPLGQALELAETGNNLAITEWVATTSTAKLERELARVNQIVSELTAMRASFRQARERHDKDTMQILTVRGQELHQELARYSSQATIRMYLNQGLKDQVVDEIMLLLCWAQDMVNVQTPLTPEQMQNCAALIVHSWAWLRKEDIALCLRNAVRGDYGKLYGKMDAQDILGWVMKYAEELQEERARQAESARALAKERPGDPIADSLRAVWKRLDNKQIK